MFIPSARGEIRGSAVAARREYARGCKAGRTWLRTYGFTADVEPSARVPRHGPGSGTCAVRANPEAERAARAADGDRTGGRRTGESCALQERDRVCERENASINILQRVLCDAIALCML